MARVMMAKVAGPALCTRLPSVAKAALPLGNTRSVMFAPISRFSGRGISGRQSSPVRIWQIRAQSTATETEKVAASDDIIDKIKQDHRELKEYFQSYKDAIKRGDESEAMKWFNQFVWEISRHSVSEELVLYPLLEDLGEKGQKLADQSRREHRELKEILVDLQKTNDVEAFDEKMDIMMAQLKDHIKLEESEDLTYLEQKTEPSTRETRGTMFELGKKIAPSRPHLIPPEKPVAIEAALGLLLTPIDKLRDMFTSYPDTDKKSVN